MRPSAEKSYLDEPLAKRLRSTRSQNTNGAFNDKGHPFDHLPSPRVTDPSSTDNFGSSSSSIPSKSKSAKPKQTQSLRDRLFPPPKKLSPPSPSDDVPTANIKRRPKPSVRPFFQRVEDSFQANPAPSKTNHASKVAQFPPRSPSPTPDDLIKQLKEHYLRTATNLHTQATMRLNQTHADLSRKMEQSLAGETAFLTQTEQQITKLSQPLDKFRIRSQHRQGGAKGAVRSEENSVGELITRAEEQTREFEEEIGGLWKEWAAAEGEVKGLLRGVGPSVAGGGSGGEVGGGEGEEMLRRFREVIEREIGEAEEEVFGLGEEAVAVMKDIEKDFRKATLPDLHTFFQSIDEP